MTPYCRNGFLRHFSVFLSLLGFVFWHCVSCRPQDSPPEISDNIYEDVTTNKKKSKKKSPPKSELDSSKRDIKTGRVEEGKKKRKKSERKERRVEEGKRKRKKSEGRKEERKEEWKKERRK